MLLAGLGEDALLARPLGQDQTWTMHTELLAQLVEVSSLTPAQRGLRSPLQVPRPKPVVDPVGRRAAGDGEADFFDVAAAGARPPEPGEPAP